MSAINRFLGDSPLRVLVKLVVVSLLVGMVMSAFRFTPWDVYYFLRDLGHQLWAMGFDAIGNFAGYILLGAVIVVPAFFILRILNFRRG